MSGWTGQEKRGWPDNASRHSLPSSPSTSGGKVWQANCRGPSIACRCRGVLAANVRTGRRLDTPRTRRLVVDFRPRWRVLSAPMTNVRSLIDDFTDQLTALVERQALDQARAAVESALGVRRPGRPAKIAPLSTGAKVRKKLPKQFCPVPGCKNPAAPVFGMVCANHKDVAKTKIRKYREARKAAKLGVKPAKATKPRTKKVAGPKPSKAAKQAKATKPAKRGKPTKPRTKKVARPTPVATVANPPTAAAA
jgi:hypothetical protein